MFYCINYCYVEWLFRQMKQIINVHTGTHNQYDFKFGITGLMYVLKILLYARVSKILVDDDDNVLN